MVIKALSQVNPPQYREFTESILPLLTPDMDEFVRLTLIQALIHVDPSQCRDLRESLQPLTNIITAYSWKEIINLLLQVDPFQRRELAEILASLLTDTGGFFAEDENDTIIRSLSHVEPFQRLEFAAAIQSLALPAENLERVVETLALTVPEKRIKVCKKFHFLLNLSQQDAQDLQNWNRWFKKIIISILQREDPLGFINIIERALHTGNIEEPIAYFTLI